MSSHVETTNFFTAPGGMRGGGVAPRWVPMLFGLFIGTSGIAVEAHGIPRIVTAVVAVGMLLALVLVGRPRIVSTSSESTTQH